MKSSIFLSNSINENQQRVDLSVMMYSTVPPGSAPEMQPAVHMVTKSNVHCRRLYIFTLPIPSISYWTEILSPVNVQCVKLKS